MKVPRDTKDQEKMNWDIISDLSLIDRGVLIFWKGHVGVMIDKKNLLHANATSMSAKVENLDQVMARHINNKFGDITKMITHKL